MGARLSNNEIQKQLSKEEIERIKKEKQNQLNKVIKK